MSKIPTYRKSAPRSRLTISNSGRKHSGDGKWAKGFEGSNNKEQFALLEIRKKLIEHLLEESDAVRRLVKENEMLKDLLLATEIELMEKGDVMNALRAVVYEKHQQIMRSAMNS